MSFDFTSIQLNKGFASKLHVDAGDMGPSYIMGDYEGGELHPSNSSSSWRASATRLGENSFAKFEAFRQHGGNLLTKSKAVIKILLLDLPTRVYSILGFHARIGAAWLLKHQPARRQHDTPIHLAANHGGLGPEEQVQASAVRVEARFAKQASCLP